MTTYTDRIEKRVLLHAPVARVWRAITDSGEFGTWFGAEFDGEFRAGATVAGRIRPTKMDAEVAKTQEPHDGVWFEVFVERMDAMTLFSYRWHPYEVEPGTEFSSQPSTLVEMHLQETGDGTMLTITESGFDSLPLERRADALKSNDQGWQIQTTLIDKYLRQDPQESQ